MRANGRLKIARRVINNYVVKKKKQQIEKTARLMIWANLLAWCRVIPHAGLLVYLGNIILRWWLTSSSKEDHIGPLKNVMWNRRARFRSLSRTLTPISFGKASWHQSGWRRMREWEIGQGWDQHTQDSSLSTRFSLIGSSFMICTLILLASELEMI